MANTDIQDQSENAALKPKRGRPRKAPVDQQARQALIRCGLVHLTERGYSSVGIDDILRDAGVPKGSFYYHFKSKADFGLALIAAYHDYFLAKLTGWFGREDLAPLDRLRGFVADARSGMARHGFARGCLVGNLGQEMAALPEDFRDRLIAVLREWQDVTAACLKQAQAAGEINPDHDVDGLAGFFWIGWEGAVLRAKLERRAAPLQNFADGFFRLATSQVHP